MLFSEFNTSIWYWNSLLALLILDTDFLFHSKLFNMLNFKLKNKGKQNRISFSILNNVSILILAANFSFENSVLCLYFSQLLQNLFTANLTDYTLHSTIFGHQTEKPDLSKSKNYVIWTTHRLFSSVFNGPCIFWRIDWYIYFLVSKIKRKIKLLQHCWLIALQFFKTIEKIGSKIH